MDVLWVVNTNTFLLILLIVMVSYLTTQVNYIDPVLKKGINFECKLRNADCS